MVLVVSMRCTSMKNLWRRSGKPAKISTRMKSTKISPLKRIQAITLVWRSSNKITSSQHLWSQCQTKISSRMMSKYKKYFSKQMTIIFFVNVVLNMRLRFSRTSIEQSSKIFIVSQVRESAHSKPKQE
jgi:hypothetical protein